jgi:hypothetical protein
VRWLISESPFVLARRRSSPQAQSLRVWISDDAAAEQVAEVGGGDGVGVIPGRHHDLVER